MGVRQKMISIFLDFIDNDIIMLSVLLRWYLKDYRGQLTHKVFDILHILCGGYFPPIEINLFQ